MTLIHFIHFQYYRPNQNKPNGPQRGNNNNKTPLKFESEFDFEQANSKFEELRSQLAKLKVGLEENKNTEQVIYLFPYYFMSYIWHFTPRFTHVIFFLLMMKIAGFPFYYVSQKKEHFFFGRGNTIQIPTFVSN